MTRSSVPLSESPIWNLSARVYRERGLEPWKSGMVPQRVTSNGYLAGLYAGIIEAFARDLDPHSVTTPPLILEVGGGSGLFAWLLLNRLLRHPSGPNPIRFDYLLTDDDPQRVRAWLQVGRLRAFVETHPLHLGVLEIDGAAPSALRASDGTRFDLTNRPVVLIANYVMDSIPADLFRIKKGRVLKEFVEVAVKRRASEPFTMSQVTTRFEAREVMPPYTGHAGIDEVLESYRALSGEPCIPVSAPFISFVGPWLESPNPFLLLAGDLGYTTAEFESVPPLVHEDYFACRANFHLLGRVFEQCGGSPVFPPNADRQFSISVFLKPTTRSGLERTREVSQAAVSQLSPHDAINIEEALGCHGGPLNFDMVSAWLRLARCDAHVASLCIPHLLRIVEAKERYQPTALRDLLIEAFRCELPAATGEDSLATPVAVVLLRAGMYSDAADFLDLAFREVDRCAVRLHLRAVAAARLGNEAHAAALLAEIKEKESDYWVG